MPRASFHPRRRRRSLASVRRNDGGKQMAMRPENLPDDVCHAECYLRHRTINSKVIGKNAQSFRENAEPPGHCRRQLGMEEVSNDARQATQQPARRAGGHLACAEIYSPESDGGTL